MAKRRAPDWSSGYHTERVLIFSKKKRPDGPCFEVRRISRGVWDAQHSGGTVRAVRYDNRAWRIYEPKEFSEQLARWSDASDPIYYENGRRMTAAKPAYSFFFTCERALWVYE